MQPVIPWYASPIVVLVPLGFILHIYSIRRTLRWNPARKTVIVPRYQTTGQ